MQLSFDPGVDDEEAYQAVRDELVSGLERYLVEHSEMSAEEASRTGDDAAVALDWKWGYGDGELAWWDEDDIEEFLVDWCPRKLSIPADSWADIPEGLVALIDFLEADGLIDEESEPAAALHASIREVVPAYLEAMQDPANYGMAKSLFAGMLADGIDPGDPTEVAGWIEAFNALSLGERERLLPDAPFDAPFDGEDSQFGAVGGHPRQARMPDLLPVILPDAAAEEASRRAAPVLAKFALLAQFFSDGRKLTQKGHLTLADAAELVELLGTGDAMDYEIRGKVFRTRSADDLPGLRQLVAWARKAGVLRIAGSKLAATPLGRKLEVDPAAGFDRAVTALMEIGPIASRRRFDRIGSERAVMSFLDASTVHVLALPYVAGEAVPAAELADAAFDAVSDAFVLPGDDDTYVRLMVSDALDTMLDALELAGLVERPGVERVTEYGRSHGRGGMVVLSDAGIPVTRRLLGEAGFGVPVAGALAGESAEGLMRGIAGEMSPEEAWMEVQAWAGRRDPEQAVRELVEAVPGFEEMEMRQLGLVVAGSLGEASGASEGLIRELAERIPDLRGLAKVWLVDNGFDLPGALWDPSDPDSFPDVLGALLMVDGPERMLEAFGLVGAPPEQLSFLDRIWRQESPSLAPVLDAIGSTHPVRQVAKEARKTAMRHRTWLANR